jgi:hypothetical protein
MYPVDPVKDEHIELLTYALIKGSSDRVVIQMFHPISEVAKAEYIQAEFKPRCDTWFFAN